MAVERQGADPTQPSLQDQRSVWFSFFHEAGHILLHGKKAIFIDEQGGDRNDLEQQANRFACDILIPPAAYARFLDSGDFSSHGVKQFAQKHGVAPGIVVGRLQHDGHVEYSAHHALKERLEWAVD